jgi:hypothetical protein
LAEIDREVWIAGFPGYWGGADTELDHLVDLFRAHGIDMHFVPMFHADPSSVSATATSWHIYQRSPYTVARRR